MTKRMRGWDEFAKEAEETYDKFKIKEMELPLSEDEVIKVSFPTLEQQRQMDAATSVGDYDTAARVLFGEEQAERLIELSKGLHINPLVALVRETVEEFGLANVKAMLAEMDGADGDEVGKDSPPKPADKPVRARKSSRSTPRKSSTTSSNEE